MRKGLRHGLGGCVVRGRFVKFSEGRLLLDLPQLPVFCSRYAKRTRVELIVEGTLEGERRINLGRWQWQRSPPKYAAAALTVGVGRQGLRD